MLSASVTVLRTWIHWSGCRQYTAGSPARRKADWPTCTRRLTAGGEPGRTVGARLPSSLSMWSAARCPSPLSHCLTSPLTPPAVSTTSYTGTAKTDAYCFVAYLLTGSDLRPNNQGQVTGLRVPGPTGTWVILPLSAATSANYIQLYYPLRKQRMQFTTIKGNAFLGPVAHGEQLATILYKTICCLR